MTHVKWMDRKMLIFSPKAASMEKCAQGHSVCVCPVWHYPAAVWRDVGAKVCLLAGDELQNWSSAEAIITNLPR